MIRVQITEQSTGQVLLNVSAAAAGVIVLMPDGQLTLSGGLPMEIASLALDIAHKKWVYDVLEQRERPEQKQISIAKIVPHLRGFDGPSDGRK